MSDFLDPKFLFRLAVETIRDPKAGATEILVRLPNRAALWLAFALMVVASLIMGEVVGMIMEAPVEGPLTGQSPLALGLLQGMMLFLTVHAITHIGRLCGGTGEFDGALALITWLQFIFFLIQIFQIFLLLTAPLVAGLVTIVALGLFFWLLVNFIAVLHGFPSVGMVFFMTLVSFVSILFLLSLVLSVLGIGLETQAI